MWVVWIRGVLGTDVHVDAAPASPAGDEGERPIRPWQLVVVSAARAAQSHGDPARALWESGDEELRARRTVVVRIDESVPGIRADRCLVDLAHGNATRGRATLERALRVLGALPSPVHTSPDPTSARFPPDGPALCRIPPADPTFVGRDDVLAALHRQLVTADSSTGLRSVCLWGLGGVGKTSTALAYAHQFQRYYETVWWLRAETEADLRGDLVDLGSQLGVPTDPDMSVMLREVQQRIAGTENTLLIFDNAEPESWLRDLWPRGRGVHLLVTTRQPDWTGLLSADQRTEILPPELTDAARLLLKASEAERPPPQEQEAARAVAADLGCLPLALAHAAAYVRQSGITLQHFHALLTTSRQRLLNEYQPDHSSTPVTLTWSLSLRRSDEQTPGTADLMALCAMLAPDEIPRQLLHVHADALGGTLGTVLADLVAFDAVVRSLVKYSLVKAAPDALRLHRLVQDAVLSGLTAADAVQWLTRAAAMVLAAFPEDVEDLEQWPACDRLTGHAQAIVVRYGQVPHELCAEPAVRALTAEVATVALRCGEYQLERGNFGTADSLLCHAVDLFRDVTGESGSLHLIASARSALVSYRLADLAEARRRAETTLAACSDATDPMTYALVLHTLARILIEYSELEDAHRFAQAAHHALDRAPADSVLPAGEGRAAVERTLGIIQWRRGDYPSAVRWIRRADAHEDDRRAHRHRFEPLELALAELSGDREQIRAIGEQAEASIAALETVLGSDHRDLVGRRNLAGEAAALLGDHDTARSMFRAALEGLVRSHGSEHPSTAWAERNLGGVLCRQGEHEEGLPLLRHALAIYERQYGTTHPYAAEGLAALGSAEAVCGLREQAEHHLREAGRMVELAYGPIHPKLAYIFEDLATLLLARDGASAEATALSDRAATIRLRARTAS
ncbi:tetratricopeptide repeat protein [Streptomyces sp. NBC_01218]|uniref:tetratricopeptide repeat protein n=1 Tax=Streptomyces sp. NBC_01218 TaxID=2903780 RepID=UPI002E136E54|nr:tetratricopeptide repeat protein [Streptomyces sp. NBC_01218]